MDCTLKIGGKTYIVTKNWKMKKGTRFLDFRTGVVGQMTDNKKFAEQVSTKKILSPVEVIKEL